MITSKRLVRIFGAMIGVAAVAAIAYAAMPRAAAPVEVVRVAGYSVPDSPEVAAEFGGNEVIVIGEVQNVGQARWNTTRAEDALRMIFRPLNVRVDEVLKGTLNADHVMVRHLGGQVDNVRYEFENSPELSSVGEGTRVLLFLGRESDPGGGFPARTPNMWYVIDGTEAHTPNGEFRIGLDEFREMIAAHL